MKNQILILSVVLKDKAVNEITSTCKLLNELTLKNDIWVSVFATSITKFKTATKA